MVVWFFVLIWLVIKEAFFHIVQKFPNMGQSQCPECHSIGIKFFEARKSYGCIDCCSCFSDRDHRNKKFRILVSYGYPNNEELVRLIKTVLEKHGHDIGFYNNEINFGDKLRIINKYRLLKFISKIPLN